MRDRGIKRWSGLLLTAMATWMFLAGCAATPAKSPYAQPEWVMNDPNEVFGDKHIYGVGVAANISNPALLRSTADNAARTEIVKILDSKIKNLIKRYNESTSSGDKIIEGQRVQEATQTLSRGSLQGAKIVKRWRDPANGNMYALCKIEMDFIKQFTKENKELSDDFRRYLLENAEVMHEELQAK